MLPNRKKKLVLVQRKIYRVVNSKGVSGLTPRNRTIGVPVRTNLVYITTLSKCYFRFVVRGTKIIIDLRRRDLEKLEEA